MEHKRRPRDKPTKLQTLKFDKGFKSRVKLTDVFVSAQPLADQCGDKYQVTSFQQLQDWRVSVERHKENVMFQIPTESAHTKSSFKCPNVLSALSNLPSTLSPMVSMPYPRSFLNL